MRPHLQDICLTESSLSSALSHRVIVEEAPGAFFESDCRGPRSRRSVSQRLEPDIAVLDRVAVVLEPEGPFGFGGVHVKAAAVGFDLTVIVDQKAVLEDGDASLLD